MLSTGKTQRCRKRLKDMEMKPTRLYFSNIEPSTLHIFDADNKDILTVKVPAGGDRDSTVSLIKKEAKRKGLSFTVAPVDGGFSIDRLDPERLNK